MNTMQLCKYAEENQIDIDYFPLKVTKSLSIRGSIALNPTLLKTETETKECLAHELGHQMTGSFYRVGSKFETRERMEYRATKWAVTMLIPSQELQYALDNGCTEIWQLAEHFNVSPQFMEYAMQVYQL